MNNKIEKIKALVSPRLKAVANLVRECDCVADIGTDHAYLPVYLVLTGKAKAAIASDISEGPCASAEKTVEQFMLTDKITVKRACGLDGIDLDVTDIVIAGMGGQLIADILDKDINKNRGSFCAVLQPMTNAHLLRKYLYENGFEILDECVVKEKNKCYIVIKTLHTGKNTKYSTKDLYVSSALIGHYNQDEKDYVQQIRNKYKKAVALIDSAKDSQRKNENKTEYENILTALDF